MEKKVVVESIHETLPESTFFESPGSQSIKNSNRSHGILQSSFGQSLLTTDSINTTTSSNTVTIASSTSSRGEQVTQVEPQWTSVNWNGPPLKLQRTFIVRRTSLSPAMSFEDVPNIKENQGPANVSEIIEPLNLHANLKRKIFAQCLPPNRSKAPKYLKVYKKNLKPKVDVPMKNAPCSSSVENYIRMDTLEKGAEVLDHLDEAAYSGLIKNVMDVTNARHGDYLEKGLKAYLGEEMFMQMVSSTLEFDPPSDQFQPNNPSSANESLLTSSKPLQNSNIKELATSNESYLKQNSLLKPIGNTNLVLNPKALEIKAKGLFNFDDKDRHSLTRIKDEESNTVAHAISDEDTFVEVDKIIADKISWMRDHNYSNDETVTFKTPDFDSVMPENIFESLEVIMEDRKLGASVEQLEALAIESDRMPEVEILNSHEPTVATTQISDMCNLQQASKQVNGNVQSVLKPKIFKESLSGVGDQNREQRKLDLLLKRVQCKSLGERTQVTCVAKKTSLNSSVPAMKGQDTSASSSKEAMNIVEKIDKEITLTKEIYISNNSENNCFKFPSKEGEINFRSNISSSKLKKEKSRKRSFPSKLIKSENLIGHKETASLQRSLTKPINRKEKRETENKTSCFGDVLSPTKVNFTETSIGRNKDITKNTLQSGQRGQSTVNLPSREVTSCKMKNLRLSILESLRKSPPTAMKSCDLSENSDYQDWELQIKQNRVEVSQNVINDATKRPDTSQKEYLQRLLIFGDLEPNTSESTGQKDLEPLEKDLRVINVELGPPMEVDSIMQVSGKNAASGKDSAVCQASNAAEEIMAKDQGNTVCVLLMEKSPQPDITIAGKEIVGSKVEIKAIVCKLEQPLEVKELLTDNILPTKEQIPLKDIIGTEESDSSGIEREIMGFKIEQPLDRKVWPVKSSSDVLQSAFQRHIVEAHKLPTAMEERAKELDGTFELPFEMQIPPNTLNSPEKVPGNSVKADKASIPLEIDRKIVPNKVELTLEVKASAPQEDIVDKETINLPFETDEKKVNFHLEMPLEVKATCNALHERENEPQLNFVKLDKATFPLETEVTFVGKCFNFIESVSPKNCVKTGNTKLPREIHRNEIGSRVEASEEVPRVENSLCNQEEMPQSNIAETDKSDLLFDNKVHLPNGSLKKEYSVRPDRTELLNEHNINLTENHLEGLEVNLLSLENTLPSPEKMSQENLITIDKSKLFLPENSLRFLENCNNTEKTEVLKADAKTPASKLELSTDAKAPSPDNTVVTTAITPEKNSTRGETGEKKSKTCEKSSFVTSDEPIEKTTTHNKNEYVEQSIVKLAKLQNSFEDIKELRLKGSIRNNLFESFAQKLIPAVHNGKSVNDLTQLLIDFQQNSFDNCLEEKCTIYSTLSEEKNAVTVDAKEVRSSLDAKSNGEIFENEEEQLAGLPKMPPIQQASEDALKEFGIAQIPEKSSKVRRKSNEKTLSSNMFKHQRSRKLSVRKRRNILKQQALQLSSRIRIRIRRVQRTYRQFQMFVRRINSWLISSSMESFYLPRKVQHLRQISCLVDKTLMTFETMDVVKLEGKFKRIAVVLNEGRISSQAKIKRNLRGVINENQNGAVLEQKSVGNGDTLKSVSGGDLEESLAKRQPKMYINRKKRVKVAADRLSNQLSKTSHSDCVIDAIPASPASVVMDKSAIDQLMPELPKPLFALEQIQDQTTGYGLETDIRESEALRNAPKKRKKRWTQVSHRYSLRSLTSGIGSQDREKMT